MTTPHKHAEVAIAWLKDQAIKLEYKHLVWLRWERQRDDMNPLTHPLYEWRIKPEPKSDVVFHCHMGQRGFDALTERFISGDNLKLTFDGETGKLIKAEVL